MTARLNSTTKIDSTKTKFEIESYLYSRDATHVAAVKNEDFNCIIVTFRLFNRQIKMIQKLATEDSAAVKKRFAVGGTSPKTQAEQIKARIKSEEQRRWRVMLNRVKLRLDMIFDEEDLGDREEAFNYEFMPDVMLPAGGTVREFMEPQITEAYKVGRMPTLLPGPGAYRLLESSTE